MSSIRKLGISGVRSYEPDAVQTLEFFHPLTIIVGRNGCGKTTVIEALRFATTGEHPPLCDKGRSFVHDPHLTGTATVRGQVRLQMESAAKRGITVVRSFRLTQRGNKRNYKAVDAALKTEREDGSTDVFSYKNAQMDTLVPQFLGVSRAILDNVIFCHQEESSWPLADAKTVKARFEDIFASTRYSRALDNLRKMRTAKKSDLRVLEVELESMREKQIAARALTDRAFSLKEKMKKLVALRRSKQQELDKATARFDELKEQNEKVNQLKQQLIRYKGEFAVRDQAVKDATVVLAQAQTSHAADNLDFDDPTEDLLLMRSQLAKKLPSDQKRAKNAREAVTQAEAELETCAKKLYFAQQQAQTAEALENEIHQGAQSIQKEYVRVAQNIVGRPEDADTVLSMTARALAESSNLDAMLFRVETWSSQMQTTLQELQKTVENLQREHATALQRETQELNQMEAQHESLRERAQHQRNTAEEGRQRTAEIESKLKSLARANATAQTVLEDLRAVTETIEHENYASKMGELEKQRDLVSRELTALEEKAEQLRSQSSLRTSLSNLQASAAEAEHDVQELCTEAQRRVQQVCGVSVELTASNFEAELETQQRALRQKLDEARELHEQHKLQLRQLRTDTTSIDSAFQTLLKDAKAIERKLKGKTAAEIEEALRQAQLEYDQNNALVQGNTIADALERLLRVSSRGNRCCALCDRRFEDEDFAQFKQDTLGKISKLRRSDEKKRSNAETRMNELAPLLKSLPADIEEAHRLTALRERLKKQREHLLKLQKDSSRVEKEYAEAEQKVGYLVEKCDALAQIRRTSEQIQRNAARHARYQLAATNLEAQLLRIQKGGESFNDIVAEVDVKRAQRSDLEKRLSEFQKQQRALLDKQSHLNNTAAEVQKLVAEGRALREERERVRVRIADSEDKALALKKSASSIQSRLSAKRLEYAQESSKRQALIGSKRSALHAQQEKARPLADARVALKQRRDDVRHRTAKLQQARQQLQQQRQLAQQHERLKKQLVKSRQDRAAAERQLDNVHTTVVVLDATLKLRAATEALAELRNNAMLVKKRVEEINGLEVSRASRDAAKVQKEAEQAVAVIGGKLEAYSDQAKKISDEAKKYEGIDELVRAKLVEHETTKLAGEDLDKYRSMLDAALLQFHRAKMREINDVLRALWSETYQGHDIEEIFIRAQAGRATAGGTARRDYSYSVMMLRNGSELEMRGRCSAGQRVLASLLIRMALAETFCASCGVMTLDEPTTNLDGKNIKSLADALNKVCSGMFSIVIMCVFFQIIQRRREHQRNFQLVLITHDEEFANMIGRRDLCDYYYRISKDDRGYSRIGRHAIR
ncbi:MAG: hypothetical protein MHM6MM_004091 [Cercozoa sp. M6MM]